MPNGMGCASGRAEQRHQHDCPAEITTSAQGHGDALFHRAVWRKHDADWSAGLWRRCRSTRGHRAGVSVRVRIQRRLDGQFGDDVHDRGRRLRSDAGLAAVPSSVNTHAATTQRRSHDFSGGPLTARRTAASRALRNATKSKPRHRLPQRTRHASCVSVRAADRAGLTVRCCPGARGHLQL